VLTQDPAYRAGRDLQAELAELALEAEKAPGLWQPARQGGEHETISPPPAHTQNLHVGFQDADLVPQHQQLGLISGAVAKGCEGEVNEEPEAGVKDEEEHGRRLIVAGL
jgi:hypothetical protein